MAPPLFRLFCMLPLCLLGAGVSFGEGKTPAPPGIGAAVEAARRGDITGLIGLEGDGVRFDQRDTRYGLTPPEMARISGRVETVEWFRTRGMDVRSELPALEGIAERMLRAGIDPEGPGIAVLVGRGDEILFQGGFGMADIGAKEPVTPETIFRIGSITKQFTAAAILMLAEERELSLEDRLIRYFPDFPRAEQITLQQLLTHTSGLSSYTSKPGFMRRAREEIEPGDLIDWFREDGFEFDPGAGWSYSNSGYFLLGEIAGMVAEEPWGEYLSRRVFDPLEMAQTGVHRPGLGLVGEAVGYAEREGEIVEAPDWHMSWAGGAGAMYSTVTDLFRWNRAIFSDKVLSAKMRRLAHEPVKIEGEIHLDEAQSGYGYGWEIKSHRGRKIIGHGGGVAGFLSYLAYVPEDDLAVVVLSNSSPPAEGTMPMNLWKELVDLYLWESLPPRASFRRAAEVEEAQLLDYVGTYDFKLLGTLRVTLAEGKLRAQISAQPEVELEPQGADTFHYADGDAEFRFWRDDSERAGEVTLIQSGFRVRGERYTEPEEVAVEPELLRRYVGNYKAGTEILAVRVGEGGGLTAKLGSQPAFPIFPSSDTAFYWKAMRAEIEFESDPETGEVIAAKHFQGGRRVLAPKMRPTNPVELD